MTDYTIYTDPERANRLDDPTVVQPPSPVDPFAAMGVGPPIRDGDPDESAAQFHTSRSPGGSRSPVVDKGRPGVSAQDLRGGPLEGVPTRGDGLPEAPEGPLFQLPSVDLTPEINISFGDLLIPILAALAVAWAVGSGIGSGSSG